MARSALLIALLLCGAIAPAQAQLFSDNDARKAILELRQKISDQERAMQAQDAAQTARIDRLEAAQRSQLELANQIDGLKQELAKLRGQNESLANEVATLQKHNRDLYTDIDTRLKKFEPVTVNIDGRNAQVDQLEQASYEAALAQFRGGDFKGAAAAFQSFMARYPQSAYGPSTQYWLGSSLYAMKDYKASIAAQQTLVDRYRDSPRVADALLSMAASQLEAGDKRGANRNLQKLIKDFPDTDAAKLGRERLPATR